MTNLTPAPAWDVSPLVGDSVPDVSDYQGKPTLILFFSVTCAGCMGRALPLSAQVTYLYPGLNVVAIHSQFESLARTPDFIRDNLAEYDLPFRVLLDNDHRTFDAYEAEGTPHWVILDADGNITRSFFGSQPNAQQRLDFALREMFPADEAEEPPAE